MKKIIPLFVLLSLLFSSCKPILLIYFGITKPKLESIQSLEKYAKKINLNSNSIYFIDEKDSANLKLLKKIPDAYFFDRNGNRIDYRANDSSCNADVFKFITNLNWQNQNHKYIKDKSYTQYLNSIQDKNRMSIENEIGNYDYYIFINWTKYSGRLNKDHVREWQNLITSNKNAKIKYYLVNFDVLDTWDKNLKNKFGL